MKWIKYKLPVHLTETKISEVIRALLLQKRRRRRRRRRRISIKII
jgi:hypothetical protein